MRKHLFFIVFLAFLTALSVSFSACTKDEVPPKTPTVVIDQGGSNACSDSGTIVQMICGASAINGLFIELDNGILLQPCEIFSNNLGISVPLLEPGMRVKVGYQLLQGPTACDSMVMCLAIDPRAHLAKKVRITCMERIYSLDDCKETATVQTHPGCQLRYLVKSDSTKYEPVNQIALSGYADGDQIDFSKEYVCTLVPLCTGYIGVEIQCIRRHVMLD